MGAPARGTQPGTATVTWWGIVSTRAHHRRVARYVASGRVPSWARRRVPSYQVDQQRLGAPLTWTSEPPDLSEQLADGAADGEQGAGCGHSATEHPRPKPPMPSRSHPTSHPTPARPQPEDPAPPAPQASPRQTPTAARAPSRPPQAVRPASP